MDFLEIINLSKSYDKQKVLNKINVAFPNKGLFCLVGESGGGKSTFINCITGIEKMDKGEVYFQGEKIKNFDEFRNKYIGMIYQNINLISFLNVSDNVNIKKENNIDNELIKLEIDKFEKTKINVLSGGERQRVAIARAISSDTKILLCDEPTGSLDRENAIAVMNILKELSKNILVIVATHNMDIVNDYADHVVKIKNNNITSTYKKKENNRLFSVKLKRMSIKHMIKMGIYTLLRNKMKMIMSIISLSISFSFLLFSLNASNNVDKLIKENKQNYLDYNMLRIVKEKSSKIENTSLTLVKEERLKMEDIKELSYLIDVSFYKYDLTPIFTFYPDINCPIGSSNYISNVEFVPYSSKSEILFENKIEGRFPKYENEVVINKACRKYLSTNRFNISISKIIDLKLNDHTIISDSYSIDENFKIVGQVKEFELLETPKIYYSYDYLKKLSKEIDLVNLSKYLNEKITLYDRLTTIRGEDDSFASNYLYVEIPNNAIIDDIYKRVNSIEKDNERFKISNSSIEKLTSFDSLFDSIELVLSIFVGITLLISVLLLCLCMFSYVLDYKKDIGIMMGIGILRKDIRITFIIQSLIIGFISLTISMLFYILLSSFINKYLFSLIKINILENSISFSSFIYISSIYLVISIMSSFMTSFQLSRLNVASILKEE